MPTDGSQQNGLDVSLSMITPNHPLLDPRYLEAEGMGLLDRMLGVLQDNSRYETMRRAPSHLLLSAIR